MKGFSKYKPYEQIGQFKRKWPDNVILAAPAWCSVDLRDGNQALVTPMNLGQKLKFFKTLIKIGFKEIEVGFPSASEVEFETTRALIEGGFIPDDVKIQVLVQAREHLILKTFEAIKGAKNVVLHIYNSTSALQRKVVFDTDIEGVAKIAVEAARLVHKLGKEARANGVNITYEYSPESFTGTEPENAVYVCNKVMEAFEASPKNKVILNLPSTVEASTPNCFADRVEYVCKNIKNRNACIISIHPHNDRGTAVASAELGIMAGAERVEGTIFGNGERTGNGDIVTMAMNLYTQGVDPKLDFSAINDIKKIYEECTGMKVPERHPYVGELVFTAFSGSHQDAINKGLAYIKKNKMDVWEVPYLPIDPADIGRQYEPIIRINSQSGKGGAAFVMKESFGYFIPKELHPEFGAKVQESCEKLQRELLPNEVYEIFRDEYIGVKRPYHLKKYRLFEENTVDETTIVDFEGVISFKGMDYNVFGKGNGPIDAFFTAIRSLGLVDYEFASYSEHAVSTGADSKAVSYIQLRYKDKIIFGVGLDGNISLASIKGIISAINRNESKK